MEIKMAYTMTSTTTKPADKVWWNTVDPAGAVRYGSLFRNHTGVSSFVHSNDATSTTTWVTTTVFVDKASCDTLLASLSSNTDAVARDAYNAANGIIQTRTFA
jgi:hypothetical protein